MNGFRRHSGVPGSAKADIGGIKEPIYTIRVVGGGSLKGQTRVSLFAATYYM